MGKALAASTYSNQIWMHSPPDIDDIWLNSIAHSRSLTFLNIAKNGGVLVVLTSKLADVIISLGRLLSSLLYNPEIIFQIS